MYSHVNPRLPLDALFMPPFPLTGTKQNNVVGCFLNSCLVFGRFYSIVPSPLSISLLS